MGFDVQLFQMQIHCIDALCITWSQKLFYLVFREVLVTPDEITLYVPQESDNVLFYY